MNESPPDNLQAELLIKRRLRVVARKHQIIFYYGDDVDPAVMGPSCVARISYVSLLFFIMATRSVATSGMMIFAEKNLLRNPHYIFWGIFRHFPEWLCDALIGWSVLSDALMNLGTRGVSTAEVLRSVLYPETSKKGELDLLSGSFGMKAGKVGIIFCLVLSAFSASLVAFLGTITLSRYVTNNFGLLFFLGFLVGAANLITNIAFRLGTTVKTFEQLVHGKLQYSFFKTIVSIIGSTAFLGSCYYGANNAIRQLLAMLHMYAGDVDSGVGQIAAYEHWINGVNDATLPFALVAYVSSSCLPMFRSDRGAVEGEKDQIEIPFHRVMTFMHWAQKQEACQQYYRQLPYGHWDRWYPELLAFLFIRMMPVLVVGVVLGNILPTFNSSNGLLIHVIFGHNTKFNELQKIAVGVFSGLLTLVFAIIFWSFNMVGWFNNVEADWVRETMGILQRAHYVGEVPPLDELQQAMMAPAQEGKDQPAWARFWRSVPQAVDRTKPALLGAANP